MKQRKFPHRLFAKALALPDILLSLPFAPAILIFSTRKSSRPSGIYTDLPSNANAPLIVKGRYICPDVLGGALCNRPAHSPNAEMFDTTVVDRRSMFINANEGRFIRGRTLDRRDKHRRLD